MEDSTGKPLSGLRSLVARVLGASDPGADDKGPASRAVSGASEEDENKEKNWLSNFAAVAPDHIKRWTNPADGSGNIAYEQLVENLRQFNIPARHVSEYTAAQLLGVEPAPQNLAQAEEALPPTSTPQDRPAERFVTPRPHKLGSQAASYLGSKQHPSFTQVVPVREVTRAYIGPVRENVGAISGESCKLLKRPCEDSEVPPDYVEVVGSKHVRPIGAPIHVLSRQSSVLTSSDGAAAALAPRTGRDGELLHKPPPIYLEPLINSKESAASGAHHTNQADAVGSSAAAEYIASIPRRKPGQVTLAEVHTKEDKAIYDALNKPVVYTMGTYVWSKEQAEKGALHPVDVPPVDAYFGKICEEMFHPATPRAPREQEEAPPPRSPQEAPKTSAPTGAELCIPEILEMCRKSRDKLAAFADTMVETREDTRVGGQGLFASTHIKKGQVVFVELPLLTCDIESESMWTAFTELSESQQAAMETLQGFQFDLTEAESLWCILLARAHKRVDLARSFKTFFAKVKRNAHGIPSQARWGIYPKAAKVNHSCEPNVTYRNLDGLLVYFATRDIAPGDVIAMTYIDQLYAPASFRSKRLQQTKCFSCKCPRCISGEDKARRMLCPTCRPIKLKIVDSATGESAATLPPPAPSPESSPKGHLNATACDMKPSKKDAVKAPQLEEPSPDGTEGEDTSAHASDDDGKAPMQSSDDDEAANSAYASSEAAGEEACACAELEGAEGAFEEDSKAEAESEAGGRGEGEGSLAGDEGAQGGCADISDAASLSDGDRSQGEHSDSDASESTSKPCAAHIKTAGSGSQLRLSIFAMNGMASRSTEWYPGESSEEERTERFPLCEGEEAETSSSPSAEPAGAAAAAAAAADLPPRMYCQRGSSGVWLCASCEGRFTDDDMPVGAEDYFERLYLDLQSKFNFPTTPQWTVDVGSLIKSIEVVLGTEHWLYAACNLLLAQLYLGQWVGGTVRDAIFDRSLQHAEVFMKYVERTAREALHVDCAPLAASLMRVLLFNGRWSLFEEWVANGRLDLVRDCLGVWDEAYVAFSEAHAYLQSCRAKGELPELSVLHRYAHTAQHTVVQAAKNLEAQELAQKKTLEEATRRQQQSREAAEKRLKELQERNERLRKRVNHLKAQAAAQAKVKDVTSTHAESTLAKFMLAGVDGCVINDAALALQQAHAHAQQMQEAALQGSQLFPGTVVADMAYLPPPGVMPSAYLPLLMLDDPLKAIPVRSREARQRRAAVAREQALVNERKAQQDLDFEEDESVVSETLELHAREDGNAAERTMIYRIPGLPGTAPGEFVSVSQLLHDEEGNHAPLPLFKSFFYVDTAERRRAVTAENKSSFVVLGASGAPPQFSREELEDLEAAKHNYLHEERQQFEKEVRAGVLLAAAEAGALQDERRLIDAVEATNKVIQKMALQDAKAERALEEARLAFKGIPPPPPEAPRGSIPKAVEGETPQSPSGAAGAKLEVQIAAATVKEIFAPQEEELKRSPRETAALLPSVWEYVASQDPEKGPTVFLYPPTSPPAPAAASLEEAPDSKRLNGESEASVSIRKKTIKPLDFSRIPPPPNVEGLIDSLGNTHRHYKLSRMNMLTSRYTSLTSRHGDTQ
ncbi:uncharacterized protein LOC34618790 [Cyclospora cayetanensis]|uniref:Uncharacterized protein LOC34618790 n=1 Tax=Cyclospora cayetanensis TaxID=88456 RepID=A0A6P6S0E8_9EIME|nr:uncharacterized protein LOC34618790 [Cyclospora cayetanensis]